MPNDEWKYFENEGPFYRSMVEGGFCAWIDDVWTPDGWKPYMGDKFTRFSTADGIDASQLPEAARPHRLVVTTEPGQRRAFQILTGPPKSKPR